MDLKASCELKAFCECPFGYIQMYAEYLRHCPSDYCGTFFFGHLWDSMEQALVSSLERCPHFRGSCIHIYVHSPDSEHWGKGGGGGTP